MMALLRNSTYQKWEKKEWSLEKSQKKFYVNTCLLMKYLLPKWQGNVLGHIFGTTIDVLGVNFLVNFWNNGWQQYDGFFFFIGTI